MGINTSIATLLCRAGQQGTSFGHTLTIGRQSMTVPRAELQRLARKFELDSAGVAAVTSNGWAEEFFIQYLGAEHVSSMDYSDYESASIVHDLNTSIPEDLHERFDAVIDGGSIEHIFDVKQVLENYMQMVKPGGSLFIAAPANNLCGHGFYQFSPEFFYRVFNEDNGFRVVDMVVIETPLLTVEASRHQKYFRVLDPEKVRKRVQLLSRKPVMLFVHAEKVSSVPLFAKSPYQSDFKTQWDESAQTGAAESARAATGTQGFEYLSRWSEWRKRLRQWRKHGLHRGKFYTRFDP
ncbi:MAG: class I SAM-dependent methyltransferase [Chromatiales bacterium]|nr:MAG: class I SAM-dependent methyltransferase [Chromatiales bacterium]